MNGKKFDRGKTRFDLIEPLFLKHLAEVMTMGAEKYDANNWQNVDDFDSRYTAALGRHINGWLLGERNDQESGKSHLVHAAANLMFLHWRENNESSDVQRHIDPPIEVHVQSGRTYPASDEPNHDHELKALRKVFEHFVEVLNKGEAHQPLRTRLYDLLLNRGFTKLARTIDTPQSG